MKIKVERSDMAILRAAAPAGMKITFKEIAFKEGEAEGWR